MKFCWVIVYIYLYQEEQLAKQEESNPSNISKNCFTINYRPPPSRCQIKKNTYHTISHIVNKKMTTDPTMTTALLSPFSSNIKDACLLS